MRVSATADPVESVMKPDKEPFTACPKIIIAVAVVSTRIWKNLLIRLLSLWERSPNEVMCFSVEGCGVCSNGHATEVGGMAASILAFPLGASSLARRVG